MSFRTLVSLVLAGLILSDAAPAQEPSKEPGVARQLASVAARLEPSFVVVELVPQYDKGEAPATDPMAAWRRYMPRPADNAPSGWDSWDQVIREERPAECSGIVLSPTRVLTTDPGLHPRFIKSIAVRVGEQTIPARPSGYFTDRRGLVLELASPLPDRTPVVFDGAKPGPFYGVSYVKHAGVWSVVVAALSGDIMNSATDKAFMHSGEGLLVVNREGAAVGVTGSDLLPLDDTWKGSPESWPAMSAQQVADALARLQTSTDSTLLRVSLSFRSPRNSGEGMGRSRWYQGDPDADDMTEWHGPAVAFSPNQVLVLANFKPKTTGRLDRIRVFSADGREATGTFVASLRDWGGFVVSLDKGLGSQVSLSRKPITAHRDHLLSQVQTTIRGETREAYFWRDRLTSFQTSWNGQIFPVSGSSYGYGYGYGSPGESARFLFDQDGSLVALTLARRQKVSVAERYSGDTVELVPAAVLASVFGDVVKSGDPENRPLSEEEENRLAWLGVELQAMDEELARANGVSDQTNGGETGAIVTHVYADSPAAKAGITEGDVLLRLYVSGQPKPIEVSLAGTMDMSGMMENFWQYLDKVPDEYFDQLPRPWGNAETPLIRSLTDIGFGTTFEVESFRGGKVVKTPMKIEQGPAHYDSAKRYKDEPLGLTVRELTYEVRRYFRIKSGDPGVIVSKIEKGGKASVAGVKPYEIVTSINDQPVRDVADAEKAFKSLSAEGGELRLAVKRMTQGRIVKIRVDGAGKGDAKPEEQAKEAPVEPDGKGGAKGGDKQP